MALLERSPSVLNQHFTHPMHPLHLLHIPREFLCKGCNTLGFGTMYRCEMCNFDLHEHCAKCPITTPSPLHHHPLTLVNQPDIHKFCNLCGDYVQGLFYTCPTCEFYVHPLCTLLPLHVQLPSHPQHLLKLQPATPASCARCFEICTFWRYKCDICNLDFHFECALDDTDCVSQNTTTSQTSAIVPPTPPAFGDFTPGTRVGIGGHGPQGMPGGIMNQPYNSNGNGYGPHGMPEGIMNQPYYSNWNGYGPHGMPGMMSQPYPNGHGSGTYGPQVAGQRSNGKKRRKIYSLLGRLGSLGMLAAPVVISSFTGCPVPF